MEEDQLDEELCLPESLRDMNIFTKRKLLNFKKMHTEVFTSIWQIIPIIMMCVHKY